MRIVRNKENYEQKTFNKIPSKYKCQKVFDVLIINYGEK